MRYDDDERYLDNEEDNDLWDDELEITSDHIPPTRDYPSGQDYTPGGYADQYVSEYSDQTQDDDRDYKSYESQSPLESNNEDEDYYSDSEQEPEASARKRREGFFRKKVKEEDDEDNDFFDSDDEPAPIKKTKAPKLDPEDPDYWIEEESPLSTIIPKLGKNWKWILSGIVILLGLLIFAWVWFFRPHTDSAVKYGYIKNMERRGSIIKTFEGTMIPYKELGDPDPLYFKEIKFSVESDSLAAAMKRMMLGCVPVRVEYEVYHTALPWKGEENMIIIKADTADPKKILPPEYRKND